MTTEQLIANLRSVPDFPIKGINFKDVTTLFKNPEALKEMTDRIYDLYKDKGITKVVGVESRGFVLGSIIAFRLGAGFIPARKPGKLPAATLSQTYKKEYGTDSVEIHEDAITEDDVVLVHDDLLATGGTVTAVDFLVKRFNPKKVYNNFIIELTDFNARAGFPKDIETTVLLEMTEE